MVRNARQSPANRRKPGPKKRSPAGRRDVQTTRSADAPPPPAEATERPFPAGSGNSDTAGGEDAAEIDDLDVQTYDPTLRDTLGDFGLDDEEAVPDENDFWFDDLDPFDD